MQFDSGIPVLAEDAVRSGLVCIDQSNVVADSVAERLAHRNSWALRSDPFRHHTNWITDDGLMSGYVYVAEWTGGGGDEVADDDATFVADRMPLAIGELVCVIRPMPVASARYRIAARNSAEYVARQHH